MCINMKKISKLFTIGLAVLVTFSAFSYSVTLGAAVTAPKAPTKLMANSTATNSVKLTWTAVAAVAGYEVSSATKAAGPFKAIATSKVSNYTNMGLTASTTYFYKVRAYKLNGAAKVYSAYTAVASATTKAPAVAVAADYKGVVFYGSTNVFQLSPRAFPGFRGFQ